jgi:hypothetical protein
MVAREARLSRQLEPVQGSDSRPESAHRVCSGSPQNRRVTWLIHKSKTRGSADGDRIRPRREAMMSVDTWWDRGACVGMTRTTVKAWPPDEEECNLTILPLRGLYLSLSSRGSLVICPTPRDSYIYRFRVFGQTIHLECFSFLCSIGLDFRHRFVENLTFECMEAFMVASISFL